VEYAHCGGGEGVECVVELRGWLVEDSFGGGGGGGEMGEVRG
jgi:hypothetical protein